MTDGTRSAYSAPPEGDSVRPLQVAIAFSSATASEHVAQSTGPAACLYRGHAA